MATHPTDGSGALQPIENNPLTETRLIEIVRDVVRQEIAPVHLDISNLRLAIQGAAKKEDAITPAQVDERIQQSEERMVIRLEDFTKGLISSVKEVQRFYEAHVEESREYRRAADQRFEKQNENIIELRRDQMNMQQSSIASAELLRKEFSTLSLQVQVNETSTAKNRAYISDIDARGQKLAEGYNDLKGDVKALGVDMRAGINDLKDTFETKFEDVEKDQQGIRTFMTEQKTKSSIFNAGLGLVVTLLGLLTGHEFEIVQKIFGG